MCVTGSERQKCNSHQASFLPGRHVLLSRHMTLHSQHHPVHQTDCSKVEKYFFFFSPFCYVFQQFNELVVKSDEQQNQQVREDATALEKTEGKTPPFADGMY